MAKKAGGARKSLSAANLSALGADRLAEMLLAVAAGNANWKRRLKLELAAEVGAPDLAFELDRRLDALAVSKTRVSWRKRPELIQDLQVHRRMIVDRLADMDPVLGLDRLVAWFDLFPALANRVKDPKGELSDLFFSAGEDLAAVASAAGPAVAAPILFEALQTRLSEWGGWIGRAAPALEPSVARALISLLTDGRPTPAGRLALVTRKLADRAGDVQTWVDVIPVEDRGRPEVGAQIARRLAEAGRAADARAALELSRPRAAPASRWGRRGVAEPAPEIPDAWAEAEIAVLDAEGDAGAAQAARWTLFERRLSEPHLRAYVDRLPDFEDVEALDRAFDIAAGWHDATRGLAFLMEWPALREAAAMAVTRADEIRGLPDAAPLWVSRLEGRFPEAALALVRARARALARLGQGHGDEIRALSAEAAVLAEAVGPGGRLPSHAAFIDEMAGLLTPPTRRGWR